MAIVSSVTGVGMGTGASSGNVFQDYMDRMNGAIRDWFGSRGCRISSIWWRVQDSRFDGDGDEAYDMPVECSIIVCVSLDGFDESHRYEGIWSDTAGELDRGGSMVRYDDPVFGKGFASESMPRLDGYYKDNCVGFHICPEDYPRCTLDVLAGSDMGFESEEPCYWSWREDYDA